MEPPESLVTVELSLPVSSVPFGPAEVALPVKEENLPSSYKEKREVSEKEFPQNRPSFEAVQVSQNSLPAQRLSVKYRRGKISSSSCYCPESLNLAQNAINVLFRCFGVLYAVMNKEDCNKCV